VAELMLGVQLPDCAPPIIGTCDVFSNWENLFTRYGIHDRLVPYLSPDQQGRYMDALNKLEALVTFDVQ